MFYCDFCSYKSSRKLNLDRHKEIHNITNKKPLKCPECDCYFNNSRLLSTHKINYCKNSSKASVQKIDEENLSYDAINPIFDDKIPIPEFEKPIQNKKNLIIEEKEEKDEEKGGEFGSGSGTEMDPGKSSTRKLFKCPTCYKSYISNLQLQKHQINCKRIQNPLECFVCHKVFTASSNLSRHRKTCLENKPIPLNNFGEEDYSHIENEKIITYIKEIEDNGIVNLLKDVYNVPANQNIIYHCKTNNIVKIYKKGKWCFENTKVAIDNMIEKSILFLHKKYYEPNSKIRQDNDSKKEMNIVLTILKILSKRNMKQYKNIYNQIYYFIVLKFYLKDQENQENPENPEKDSSPSIFNISNTSITL
jgi:hypothetical protein